VGRVVMGHGRKDAHCWGMGGRGVLFVFDGMHRGVAGASLSSLLLLWVERGFPLVMHARKLRCPRPSGAMPQPLRAHTSLTWLPLFFAEARAQGHPTRGARHTPKALTRLRHTHLSRHTTQVRALDLQGRHTFGRPLISAD
jgi:hypothetical protein